MCIECMGREHIKNNGHLRSYIILIFFLQAFLYFSSFYNKSALERKEGARACLSDLWEGSLGSSLRPFGAGGTPYLQAWAGAGGGGVGGGSGA